MPTARSSISRTDLSWCTSASADDRLHISADFLILPEKGRVAMLRQVADLNINRLMLPRFRKEDDRLMMEYACPLSQSHPHKLYFILRNICHVGDRYDDEFCTKFGAQRSYEPQVTPYPEEEVTRIYEAVRQTCRETLDAVKEYDDGTQIRLFVERDRHRALQDRLLRAPAGAVGSTTLTRRSTTWTRSFPWPNWWPRARRSSNGCSQCRARRWRATFTWSTRWFRPSAAPRCNNVQENFKEVYRGGYRSHRIGEFRA